MKTKYPSMFGILAGLLLLLALPVMAITSSPVLASSQNNVATIEANATNDITLVDLSASNFFVASFSEAGILFTDIPALNAANIDLTPIALHLPAPAAIDITALSAVMNDNIHSGITDGFLSVADSADLAAIATTYLPGGTETVFLSAITQGSVFDGRYILVTDNVSNYLNTATLVAGTTSTYLLDAAPVAYADTTTQISGIYSAHNQLMPKPGMLLIGQQASNFCGGDTVQISNSSVTKDIEFADYASIEAYDSIQGVCCFAASIGATPVIVSQFIIFNTCRV